MTNNQFYQLAPRPAPRPTEGCTFYQAGCCKYGANCRFLHGGRPAQYSTPPYATGQFAVGVNQSTKGNSASLSLAAAAQLPGGQTYQGAMCYTQQRVVIEPKLVVHALFLVDASGSMSGSRKDTVLNYVQSTVDNVLQEKDKVAIFAFAAEKKFMQLYSSTFAKNIDAAVLDSRFECSGATRLYDNVVRGVKSLHKNKAAKDEAGNTILRQLVVFTDGEDNRSSEQGLTNMVAKLTKPGLSNFNFTLIAVGREGALQGERISNELEGIKHCKVVTTVGTRPEDIGAAFGKAQERMRQAREELVEKLVITVKQTAQSGAAGSVQPVLAQQAVSHAQAGAQYMAAGATAARHHAPVYALPPAAAPVANRAMANRPPHAKAQPPSGGGRQDGSRQASAQRPARRAGQQDTTSQSAKQVNAVMRKLGALLAQYEDNSGHGRRA